MYETIKLINMKSIALVIIFLATAKAGEPDSINIKLEDLQPVKATVNFTNSPQTQNELVRATDTPLPGIKAIHGFFPYQAAILVDGSRFCSGSLITSRTVLTAAHCVSKSKVNVVTVGMQKLLCVNCREESQTPLRVYIHEKYDDTSMKNDLAILKFNTPFSITTWIKTITPIQSDANELCTNWVRTSGWSTSSATDGFLHYVDLNVISNEECRKTFDDFVTSDTLCAVSRNSRSTCMVDSGSPLVDMRSGQLIGVATFRSSKGCQSGLPVAYVRLSSFIRWIQENQ